MQRGRSLLVRLEALESKMVSPLQRRLDALPSADRAAYDTWKHARVAWCRQFTGSELYTAIIDGDTGPKLPRHVERQLFPQLPQILTTDSEAEAAEKWRQIMENIR